MSAMRTPLGRQLVERIRRDGPLTFRDFMQSALYDGELGYYQTARLKIGPAGDYYTSSNLHPSFAAVLAHAFAELWQNAFDREPLVLVEMGAGSGQLAADLLAALRNEAAAIFDGARYLIIESSPAMVAQQRGRLAAFAPQVQWRTLEEIEDQPLSAIFFSNELIDALPVYRVRRRGQGLEEQFVGLENEQLTLAWRAPARPELRRYVERFGVPLRQNQIVEINLDALAWLTRLSRAIRRGFLVTIDYGDVAAHLYAPDRAA